jgi:hypothetical protein
MATSGGPKIPTDGLVLALDSANRKSTLRMLQSSNILVDPNLWTTGTGGFSGYSPNGSSSEQNRLYVNDDPWGNRSVSWRTTPDNVSGADGGWNTSYYSIDTNYTYRWSIWVRRYTTGTGGTFYLGMNPNPIRNDNNNEQGNPYFTFPAISLLTHNQWYLVVGHCFNESYTGGRHPDSGWYQNGQKINDFNFGNVGNQDVRWKSGTTSARHRAYHYYTTNVNSGIEFSYPRLDKCDGTEPTIDNLINKGESGWRDLVNNQNNIQLHNGVSYNTNNLGSMSFDGVNDYVSISNPIIHNQPYSIIQWVKPNTPLPDTTSSNSRKTPLVGPGPVWNPGYWLTARIFRVHANTEYRDVTINWVNDTSWHQIGQIYNGTTCYTIIDGVILLGTRTSYSTPSTSSIHLASETINGGSSNWDGLISSTKFYNRALTADEVLQDFNATKNRFGL